MSLLSKTITNLFNGVSQQPTGIRLDSQMEIQENSISSLTEGLKKRPPTVHIAALNSGTLGNSYHHIINRDPTNQYIVQIVNGDLKVFDLLGNPKTVLFPDGKTYLASTTPEDDFTCLTIADYTFVTNKKIVVTGTTVPGVISFDSLVYVKAGNYSTDYQIKLNGVRVAEKYTSATDVNDIGTPSIAEFLRKHMKVGITGPYYIDTDDDPTTPPILFGGTVVSAIVTAGGTGYAGATVNVIFTGGGGTGATGTTPVAAGVIANNITITAPGSGYTSAPVVSFSGGGTNAFGTASIGSTSPTLDATWDITRSASSLLIHHNTGTDYKITTQDSGYNGDTVLKMVKGEIQAFANLPTVAPTDFLVKVRAGTTDTADYYVKFVPTSATETFGPGTWVETQLDALSLNAATMPFTLLDNGDGTFTFKKGVWTASTTGGTQPSFVGQTIQDVVFYKNRLGVLAKENVVFSAAGQFFNFYRSTARAIIDTDLIDVAASSNVVAKLKHGIPFNDQLLLFSDNVQFSLSGGDILTPKTVAIAQTTAFETSLVAKPVYIGKNCVFSFVRGAFSGVKEYYVNRLTNNFDANDVTSNVPKYIPGTIKKFTKSGTEDIVIALADGDRSKLYVQKFYWNNDEKLQASWSVFNWSNETLTILFAEFINSILYLVVQRSDAVYLEKMNLASGVTDSSYVGAFGSTVYYNTLVDRKTLPLSKVYDSLAGTTTVTFPYPLTGIPKVITYTSANDPGASLAFISQSSSSIVVAGDVTTSALICGQSYKQLVRLSEPVVRQQNQSGQSIAGLERCQIHAVKIHCQDSGFFQVEVTPLYRDTTIKKFGGSLHSLETTLGLPNVSRDKSLVASVMSKSNQVTVDLTNDTHMPSSFIGIEWTLQIVYKNRKV